MLLFIAVSSFGTSFPVEFQYISCYCLSLISISYTSWLTSFQYISCYCLSTSSRAFLISSDISIHLMLLFIILLDNSHLYYQISIHLMLLFIKISCTCRASYSYFNTSHVTVYRYSRVDLKSINRISIHLMLLFIS